MGVLETHPDLPIFPGETTTTRTASSTPVTPRSAQAQNKKPPAASSVTVAGGDDDEEEQDEMTRAWPRPGQGPFNAQLHRFVVEHPDENTDYESFSQAVYAGGKKVWENGVSVVGGLNWYQGR